MPLKVLLDVAHGLPDLGIPAAEQSARQRSTSTGTRGAESVVVQQMRASLKQAIHQVGMTPDPQPVMAAKVDELDLIDALRAKMDQGLEAYDDKRRADVLAAAGVVGGQLARCSKCGNLASADLAGFRHSPCGGTFAVAEEVSLLHGIQAERSVDIPTPLAISREPYVDPGPDGAVAADRVDGGGDGAASDPPAVARPLLIEVPLWGKDAPPFSYLAGAAGCGKTVAVGMWKERDPGLMLLATTGIAALNIGGTTINAALGYFDTKALQESYTNGFLTSRMGRLWRAGVRRFVVDEVSMLEGDALTYLVKGVEELNGRGYVLSKHTDDEEDEPPAMGLTLVGDFAQLPPVNGTFAWESPEWKRFAEPGHTITLTEIRRQSEAGFIEMLRAARVGNGPRVRDALKELGIGIQSTTDDNFDGPTLFAKNQQVDRYNWIRMGRLTGRDLYYESKREGEQRSEWGNPKKDPNTWGIPLRLHAKVGALVMILANERMEGPPPQPYYYVNGDLGIVEDGNETCAHVRLKRNNELVSVAYCRREVTIPCDSARRKELRALHQEHKITENGKFEIIGWVEYMPLRIGYGSTVHKSQGLSLDAVQVNIRDAFFRSPGMMYVALSRARTAGGLRIVGSEAALLERCVADPRLKDWL